MTDTVQLAGETRPDVRPSPASAPASRRARAYRPDIEGLRAIAVLTVVLYHAGLLGVRGGFVGVDVFFVISGFLITRLLMAAVERRGVGALPDFYTRRIRRLLPAAAVVVVATVVAARIWAPATQFRSIATDAVTTTFYGLNYRLAIEGTQYLHQNDAVSPLQHFWSLAAEEQFYVVWPLLIVAVFLLARRSRYAALAVVLVAALAVSFRYSLTVTRSSAPMAYFSLHTRAWELALGALVAMGAHRLAGLPRSVARVLGWVGLAAILVAAFAYSGSTPYPGSAAALPVVGAAAVIVAGCGARVGCERLLGDPFMQSVGRVSYSWYLWHWPFLVIVPMALGHALAAPQRLAVLAVSLAVAIASYFVVENPVREMRLSTPRWFAGGLATSAVVAGTALLIGIVVPPSAVGSGVAATVIHAQTASAGVISQMAQAIRSGLGIGAAPSNLTPTVAAADSDRPSSYHNGCHADVLAIAQGPCVTGDPAGTHTVVIFGDSHADMWLPAFAAAASSTHWRLVDWTKSACPPAAITVTAPGLNRTYTECDTWRGLTERRIGQLRPDVILVGESENVAPPSVSAAQWAADTLSTLTTLRTLAPFARVVFMDDIPEPKVPVPDCVAAHLGSVRTCTFPVGHTFPARHTAVTDAVRRAGFDLIDPTDWMCAGSQCPAVVGNLLVYCDGTHLSAAFSAWLAPYASEVLASLGAALTPSSAPGAAPAGAAGAAPAGAVPRPGTPAPVSPAASHRTGG